MVLARDQAVVGAGVDDLRIARVGRDPAALAAAHVVPVLLGDAAAGGAAGDAHGGVVLLRAVDVVREIVVERHAVELRGGLVHRCVDQVRPPSLVMVAPPSLPSIMRCGLSGAIHRS